MVKIKLRFIILNLFVFMLLINLAYASSSHLLFSDVDVKVVSRTLRNLTDTSTISESVRPGGTIELRVETRNNFTDLQDMTIRDVTVKATIEEIDNGNDLEQESRSFDLRANTDSRKIFTFDIPLNVRQDTFNVIIHAEGQDDNSTIQSADMRLKLEVAKDNSLLKILQKKLTPETVSCSRNNIQLALTVLNIGNNDQDNVGIQISNSDLGISINDQVGGIRARPNEPESMLSKTYAFKVSDYIEPGSYPINIRLSYDFDRKITEETATLNVNKCTTPQSQAQTATNTQTKTSQDNSGVELVMPPQAQTQPSTLPGTIISQEGLLSSNAFVVGIIIAEVLIVIIGVVLIVGLFRKK